MQLITMDEAIANIGPTFVATVVNFKQYILT